MSFDSPTKATVLPANSGPAPTTIAESTAAKLESNVQISSVESDNMSQPGAEEVAHTPGQQQQQSQQTDEQSQPLAQQQEQQDVQPQEQPAEGASDLQQQQTEATSTAAQEDTRPDYIKSNSALQQFFESLPSILQQADHHEMWGVKLTSWDDIPTVNVLMKFLRANDGNLKLAQDQLSKALAWRKKMDPLALVNGTYSSKFAGLGYLTKYQNKTSGREEIFTWNIYGSAAKNVKETFGNLDE